MSSAGFSSSLRTMPFPVTVVSVLCFSVGTFGSFFSSSALFYNSIKWAIMMSGGLPFLSAATVLRPILGTKSGPVAALSFANT